MLHQLTVTQRCGSQIAPADRRVLILSQAMNGPAISHAEAAHASHNND